MAGTFTWTPPNADFRGVVMIPYQVKHYADFAPTPHPDVPDWIAGNTGIVTINVGERYVNHFDTYAG